MEGTARVEGKARQGGREGGKGGWARRKAGVKVRGQRNRGRVTGKGIEAGEWQRSVLDNSAGRLVVI